jgi:hypothetical protein
LPGETATCRSQCRERGRKPIVHHFIIRDGDSWEFRAGADQAPADKPGYPECVAMLVQIGDHLSKQYDLKG